MVEDHVSDEWIMDSGCNFQMSPNKGWFIEMKEGNLELVVLGNGQMC